MIVAGIAFQVATMVVCGLMMLDYFIRRTKARKNSSASQVESDYERDQASPKIVRNFRIFCYSIGLAYTTILIRCIYR